MLASFIFMVYDHMITLAEEVDRIWQQEWTGATWLFALNRYLTELQFIVNLVYIDGLLIQACDNFIPFAGASTLVSIAIAEIIMILRTYALYQRSKYILGLLAFFWTGQVIVMGTTLRHPTRVKLPEGLVGCIQGGSGDYAVAFWLAPLATDSVIFGLTMFKSIEYIYKTRYRVPLIHVILRDGILYFTVILTANLLNCLLYHLAPPSLKVIGA
ncbi:putative transmembrane protein, partial [Rhizoctonia solani 123E]